VYPRLFQPTTGHATKLLNHVIDVLLLASEHLNPLQIDNYQTCILSNPQLFPVPSFHSCAREFACECSPSVYLAGFRKTPEVELRERVLGVNERNLLMKPLDVNLWMNCLDNRRTIIRRAQVFDMVRNIW